MMKDPTVNCAIPTWKNILKNKTFPNNRSEDMGNRAWFFPPLIDLKHICKSIISRRIKKGRYQDAMQYLWNVVPRFSSFWLLLTVHTDDIFLKKASFPDRSMPGRHRCIRPASLDPPCGKADISWLLLFPLISYRGSHAIILEKSDVQKRTRMFLTGGIYSISNLLEYSIRSASVTFGEERRGWLFAKYTLEFWGGSGAQLIRGSVAFCQKASREGEGVWNDLQEREKERRESKAGKTRAR